MREMSDKISKPVVGENAQGHIVERYPDTARAVGCVVGKVVVPILIGSGDTGPVHLGAALGVRTIMLMEPTNAARNGPFGQVPHAIEVERPCKGCWKRACPKKEICLEKIPVSFVEEKIKSMG